MRPPFRSGEGRGRGSGEGRGRGFGGRSGGGRGGRGRGGFQRDEGPPAEIVEAGQVAHEVESELLCRWTLPDKVPYFNAGIYLENKRKIGKVDEILGKISEMFVTIKMDPGVLAKSFQPSDLLYIGTDKLLPLSRFTNPGKPSGGGRGGGRSSGRGGRSPGANAGGRGRAFSPGRGRGPPSFGGRGGFAGGRGGRSPGRGRFGGRQ